MSNASENDNNLFANIEINKCKKTTFVFILKPSQLNILGQVFRPVFSGNISEITDSYIVLDKVNIKMTTAPEFIFPKSLIIPIDQIAVFFEFDANKRFPLH